MKQLPETVMPKMQREKGMLRIVVLVMCIFVGIVVLRFFVYFPSAKDSIVFGVGSCIIHGVYAIGALFLPLLNKQNTKRSIAQKYSKYRKKIKWIVKILSVLLIVSFIYVFAYVFPRSFAPRIVEGDYKSHDVTKADPTDIKVIVETNLTVEAVYLKDNEVREVCIRDYKQNGIRRIFSTVLVFDAEDNNEHVITVSVRAGNDKEIIDEKELPGLYNPGKYRTAGDGSTNPTPTFKPTLSPTPTPIIKGQSELEIVCIPRKKLETEEGIREFCSYIDSASIIKLVEIYSELASSELDAFFVLTTNKKLTGIVLDAVSETTTYPSCFMKKVSEGVWYFDADFIENSMFEIVVTAYAEDGKIYHDKIKVQIPFEENYKVTHKVPVGDNVRGK